MQDCKRGSKFSSYEVLGKTQVSDMLVQLQWQECKISSSQVLDVFINLGQTICCRLDVGFKKEGGREGDQVNQR